MYYLIQNNRSIPLPEDYLETIVMVLFKHLIKLIKQLTDVKHNYFKLPHWDAFKQSARCKHLMGTLADYCEKYERDYLRHLKEANIQVIREVNQKFNELGSSEPLSLSFYTKIQAFMAPALKDAIRAVHVTGEGAKGSMEGARSLYQYYKWVDLNVKNFENYVVQKSFGVTIVKNYKNS